MTRLADEMLVGSGFVLAEWRDTGESSREFPVAPLHRHLDEEEAWYVLEGTMGFRVGDQTVVAATGEAVLVPRGTFHTYWNETGDEARYLLVMGPKTYALIEAIHATESRDPETMQKLFAAHDAELG